MHQYVYISKARAGLTDQDVEEILQTSRRNNAAGDITGILVYLNDTFIQVLEGEAEAVERLLRVITKDERHLDFVMISDQPVKERVFDQWSMGYVQDKSDIPPALIGEDGLLSKSDIFDKLDAQDGWVVDFIKQTVDGTL